MHEEILTKEATSLLPSLARFEGSYLAGGTALALHIGHRVSVDFDFFRPDALEERLLTRVKRIFSGRSISVTYAAPEHLNDRLFLGQLVSLDDVPDQRIDVTGEPVRREEIERYLKEAVRNIVL